MKKCFAPIIVMVLSAAVGFFAGALMGYGTAETAIGIAILFAVIAGFACVIYTLNNREDNNDNSD